MVIGDIVYNNAQSFPNKIAIIEERARFTWSETNSRVNCLANAMLGLGLSKGDRTAIIAQNGYEVVEFMLAVAKAGVIGTAVNYRLEPEQIARQLNDCQPGIVFVQQPFINKVETVHSSLPPGITFVSIGDTGAYALTYESLIKDYPSAEPQVEVNESDPHMIIYTSGTTGWVKGAICTYANRLVHIMQDYLVSRAGLDDVYLIDGPLFAAGAQFRFFDALFNGCAIVIYPFTAERWANWVEKEHVSIVSMTLIRYDMIREYLDHCDRKYDLSSITKVAMGGGAFQTGERIRDITSFFNVKFCSKGYASTESGFPITFLPEEVAAGLSPDAKEKDIRRLDAMGRARLCQIKIVDDKGNDVKPRQTGELWIRGDSITRGYWNKPELNQKVLAGGWYHTQDLVYQDEEGFIYFSGRKDLMIKTGGFNVYPEEVEAVIAKHPSVAEVAVFGIEDTKWGEAVTAAVALKEGQPATEEDIKKYCRRYLSGFQVPKTVHFLDKLPVAETLYKISRMELRRMFGKSKE